MIVINPVGTTRVLRACVVRFMVCEIFFEIFINIFYTSLPIVLCNLSFIGDFYTMIVKASANRWTRINTERAW